MTNRGWVVALVVLAGCDPTYHARLTNGGGLVEGSPVRVASVQVGQVEAVRVMEGQVDVELSIDRDHEITMRADACALARSTEAGPELVVLPGTGAAREDDLPIPQCEIRSEAAGDLFRVLGQGVGEMMRQLGQGLFGAGGPGTTPSPGTGPAVPTLPPFPSLGAPVDCSVLRARVDRVERAPATPVFLPDGGHRVWIELANEGEQTLSVGPVSEASFIDASGRALDDVDMPGVPDGWFMPFTVPAHGRRTVSVAFATREPPRIDRLEIGRVSLESSPLSRCTFEQHGLATP